MKKRTCVSLGLELLVMVTVFFGLQVSLQAATPPIVYVAGDGSGDYNCDGTSDQVQINQALDFVAGNSSYTTVHLKGSNTYWIDEPIVVPSNTKLSGDSSAKVQVVTNAGWPDNKPMLRQKGAIHWTGDITEQIYGITGDSISNVEISGFEMTMGTQNGATPGGYDYLCMIFYTASDLTIHDMYLHDNTADFIRIMCRSYNVSKNLKFYDNVIHNSGHDAISIRRVKDSTYGVQIYDNEITRTRTNCGIRLEDVDDISIHGNTIGNSLTSGGSGYAGIMITNSDGTVSINNVNNMEIYDNFIYGKTVGIKLVADGDKSADLYGAKIYNNRIYRIRDLGGVLHGGIWLLGPQYTHVESNTIDRSEDDGLVYEMASHHSGTGWKTYVKNNIISNTVDGHGIRNETSGAHTFDCRYNCLYHNAVNYRSASSSTDIYVDPLFVNNTSTTPELVDLHLKSKAGRWNGSSWVTDSVNSPCIDAGDPSSSYSKEPSPNGGRINIGAYGNTAEASKTGNASTNADPVADAGSNQTVTDTDDNGSEQVTLDGSGSHDSDGTITSWQWNFGDGTSGSGETVNHTYAAGHTYTATLTVTDNDNATDSDTVTITVNELVYHNLTYTAGPNGSISGNASQTVLHGENGTAVTAVPNTGYEFTSWSDGVTTASRTDTNVIADINVTASFEEEGAITYALTVTNGSGDGNYTAGTAVTISADAPPSGYYFTNWTTSNGGSFANANSANTTYTMPANAATITANFAEGIANGIAYSSSTDTFTVHGYTSATPCTLEDVYNYDQANGPLNQITRSNEGTHYVYTLNASLNVGDGAGGNTYFQIGHNTGGESKYNDEVLIITGNIIADDPGSSSNSYITVGSNSDSTLNPTIKFNCSSDGEFYIGRTGGAGHLNYYNCTLESNTGHLYNFGGDAIAAKSDTAIVNVTLNDYQTGYWSDYQGTATITDSTMNTGADGYYSGHTATLLADGINVTGGKAGIHGSYHSDFAITNSTITGTTDAAFYTSRDVGVKIASSDLTTTGSNKYAADIEVCTDDTRYIKDCSLTSTNTTYALNFGCYNSDGENASLEITNTSYNSGSKIENIEAAGTLRVDRNWYLDVRVEDTSGNPIQGATVSVSSNNGGEINTGYAPGIWTLGSNLDRITGANGHTSLPSTGGSFILRDYRRTSAGATEYTYTITASKSGYTTAELAGVNPESSWYRSNVDVPQNTQVIVLTPDSSTPHSADTNGNWSISQTEVNSFIGLYNNNNNTVATANGDITPGRITLREVVRVIYLYNNGGAYQGGQATVDTYDVAGAQGDAEAPVPVADNTITVVNSADSGAGSFRNAIADAAPGDTITFDESLDKITLASEIVIDKSITIDGNGVTIVNGEGQTRIFQIHNENEDIFVSLLNMGIVDANNSIDEFGGAIYNNGENLTLENCLFSNNTNTVANGKGGAVYNSGSLTVNNCEFSDNSASEENDIYSIGD